MPRLYPGPAARYNLPIEYRILGPLQVIDGDAELPLGPPKERALLAALLLRAGEDVSRERLIEELWGEEPPPTAAKALNVHISQLRRKLTRDGRDRIATRPNGYAIDLDGEQVDAARFERLLAGAREQVSAGDIRAARLVLGEALSLWRGHALDGIELEASARNEINRLEELRLTAQADRIDCDLALGLNEQVVGELEGLIAEHPLHERLRGQLMLALYRSGRQADALRAYRDARQTLVGELGIEPSPALQRLERGILTHDPALEAPAGTTRTAHAPSRAPMKQRRYAARSKYRLAATAAATALATATGLIFLVGGGGARARAVADSLAQIDTRGGWVSRVTSFVALPDGAASDGRDIWVISSQSETLTKVDARSGAVKASIGIPGQPFGVASGEGAIWVLARSASGTVVLRFDPTTAQVESTTPLQGDFPHAIAAGEGGVWIAAERVRGSGGALVRLSARTGAPVATIPLPTKSFGVAVGSHAVWVIAQPAGSEPATRGHIYVFDPSTDRMVAHATAPFIAYRSGDQIAVSPDAAWIATGERLVLRLDLHTASVVARIRTHGTTDEVAVGDRSVWAVGDAGIVDRIDPATSTVASTLDLTERGRPLSFQPTALLADGRSIWVTLGPATSPSGPAVPVGRVARVRLGGVAAISMSVPGGPERIRYGEGALWVNEFEKPTIARVDPLTDTVSAQIHVPGSQFRDFAFGSGSVWVTDFAANVVSRIDPRTNKVIATIPSDGIAPLGVATTPGAVWVANHHARTDANGNIGTGSIVRIDPRTNRVVARIPLGAHEFCCGPDNMVAAYGSVWVDVPNQAIVARINVHTNRIDKRIRVPYGCGQLAAGAGSIWVAEGCGNGVTRIDPHTGRIIKTIDTNGVIPYPLGFNDGSVWTTTDDLHLLQIDPASNTVVKSTSVAPATRGGLGPCLALADNTLWLADLNGNRILGIAQRR